MASKSAYKRLVREYKAMMDSPTPFIVAKPLENNILEWHFILSGPPDTAYHQGQYWGKLTFPSDYPYKPPAIRMLTPSGRFVPNERICLSMSDFHPDTWNPSWSVATILNGLLSFMDSDEMASGTVHASTHERHVLATQSSLFNRQHPLFKSVFPEYLHFTLPPPFHTASVTSNASKSSSTSSLTPPSSTPSPSSPKPYTWMLLVFSIWIYLFITRWMRRFEPLESSV
ncbi:Ubiquitin-conjugating enzyme E2 6 [Coelomomyces lativittatus]|nr:Ubiquitin-conjugating enzyme E2 6 [Coelomomyces lativittatus]KAJ1507244.1 Ubiquitin-conjugating enzyme E2 6 [Coelomomyces lativittatus]KAJ1507371.1 Ubiquitin-conjugating enzyme E2 6 [Coelomomyces lativittatus]